MENLVKETLTRWHIIICYGRQLVMSVKNGTKLRLIKQYIYTLYVGHKLLAYGAHDQSHVLTIFLPLYEQMINLSSEVIERNCTQSTAVLMSFSLFIYFGWSLASESWTFEFLSKQSRVRVMERRAETALMSKRSLGGESLYSWWWRPRLGLGKWQAVFAAHFLYFLITICRWYDTKYVHSEVSRY